MPPGPLPRALERADPARLDRHAVEEPAEVIGQLQRRSISTRRLLLQALQADRLEVSGTVRVDLRGGVGSWRPIFSMISIGSSPWKGGRPVSASYRVAPGCRRRWRSRRARGRAPARGTCRGASPGGRRSASRSAPAEDLGHPEVGDKGPVLGVDQDIPRLQVAMEDVPPCGRSRRRGRPARGIVPRGGRGSACGR